MPNWGCLLELLGGKRWILLCVDFLFIFLKQCSGLYIALGQKEKGGQDCNTRRMALGVRRIKCGRQQQCGVHSSESVETWQTRPQETGDSVLKSKLDVTHRQRKGAETDLSVREVQGDTDDHRRPNH